MQEKRKRGRPRKDSQKQSDTPTAGASQVKVETHEANASQAKSEDHLKAASQEIVEIQENRASHLTNDTQYAIAPSALQKYIDLKRLVDVYYDVQDVRMRTANRLRISSPGKTEGLPYPEQLEAIETTLKKDIMNIVSKESIWENFLGSVRGIGPCLAGGLIANIMVRYVKVTSLDDCTELQKQNALKTKEDDSGKPQYLVPEIRGIQAFPNISKLWAFCGMHTVDGEAPKRKRGELINWSPKLRTTCWKIGQSFNKQGGSYREYYDQCRRMYDERPTCGKCKGEHCSKGHNFNKAMRKTVKLFLSHMWERWRTIEHLEIRPPWIVEKGHTGKINPDKMIGG